MEPARPEAVAAAPCLTGMTFAIRPWREYVINVMNCVGY